MLNLRGTPRLLPVLMATALVALGLVACSGGSDGDETARSAPSVSDFPSAEGKNIEQVYGEQSESDLVVSPAASVFEVGKNRYPFGVFEVGGAQINDAEVALYFAKTARSEVFGPLPASVESLETKPAFRSKGSEAPGEATSFYLVNDVEFSQPGPWLAMAVIEGQDGPEATRIPSPTIGQFPNVAAAGDRAPRISTPTAESVGGDLSKIDTRQPPSSMHETDFADVVGRKPVVLQFATPALCQTRVCGPVVDVTEQVKSEFGDQAEFVHMEIYKDNDPTNGLRPQLGPFGLQTEPWLFLIDENGKIVQSIEGPFSVDELTADVEKLVGDSGSA